MLGEGVLRLGVLELGDLLGVCRRVAAREVVEVALCVGVADVRADVAGRRIERAGGELGRGRAVLRLGQLVGRARGWSTRAPVAGLGPGK